MAATASGWIGWSGELNLLPAASALPFLWAQAGSRRTAAYVSAGYFLAASRGLPQGVSTFYRFDLLPGILLWLAASSCFVLIHTLFWSADEKKRPVRYLLVMALLAVPPFGILGWAHRLTASGVLFPGWGWSGLAVMAAGLMGLASRFSPAAATAFSALWLWAAISAPAASLDHDWQGVDLEMGASLGRDRSLQQQLDLLSTVEEAERHGAAVVLLPEGALGFWTPTIERFWKMALHNHRVIVIAGAAVVNSTGYDNVMVQIDQTGSHVLYRQRMPVPGSMWQPWGGWFGKPGGAHARFFNDAVVEVKGRRIALLICYEQLLIWPILQSLLFRPHLILLIGNDWWTADTSILNIQRSSARAWARLFNLPIVMSFNT